MGVNNNLSVFYFKAEARLMGYSVRMRSVQTIGATVMNGNGGSAEGVDPVETPYAVEEFAEKYGLSRKAAAVVLTANGPSRQKSDAGARAFMAAVAAYRRR